jgi:hypothetical protein
MEQITIAGKIFNAPLRYEEGHELTAGEASALNQTFHENLRNNFAKKVKDAIESGAFDQDAFQSEFSSYADTYEFGVRSGGGVRSDPVMKEAMNIARGKLQERMRQKGIKAEASAVTEAAKKLIVKNPEIMELARQRVAEAQAAAAEDLDDVLGEMTAEAAE